MAEAKYTKSLLSADSHVMEPRDLWEKRMDTKWRDKAPRIRALDESGDYIVIELKKGHSADRVYGQCSRYMGWFRKNLAENDIKVHGVIVARQIDDRLKAARDAHDTKVHLIEFEMKIGATLV